MIGLTREDRLIYLVMDPSPRLSGGTAVPQRCIAAGAVLHAREGRTVVAHYGSVPAEIAVCLKSVGLAHHADYGVLELRGDQALLDRALVGRFGDPPVAISSARRRRSVWYLRLDARRILLVGPHADLASGPAIGRGRDRANLHHADIGASIAIVGIVGPRATRLLKRAGLPGDLALGAIGRDDNDRSVIAILRENQRRYLALVRADASDAFWSRLLTAGEPLGAALVGCDALTLLNASAAAAG